MSVKQLQVKLERLGDKISKAKAQLDAWRMERKDLKDQLAQARKSEGGSNASKGKSKARTARSAR